MANWPGVLASAEFGALIGAVSGLVPLGLGLFYRQKRNAIAGLIGCIVGGALGGVYAAIAVMGVSTGHVFRAKKTSENPA